MKPAANKILQGQFPGGRPHASILLEANNKDNYLGYSKTYQLKPAILNLNSPGKPMPNSVLQKMESIFKTDFSGVRIHTGRAADTVGAFAFTSEKNIYFASGQYNPYSISGQKLLGHELTHVVQQQSGRVKNPTGNGIVVINDPRLETEAERMSLKVVSHYHSIQLKRNNSMILNNSISQPGKKELNSNLIQMNNILGEKKVSKSERRERVFALMWNEYMRLRRTLKSKEERNEFLTFSDINFYRDMLKWATEDGVKSAKEDLETYSQLVQQSLDHWAVEISEQARKGRKQEIEKLATLGKVSETKPKSIFIPPPITIIKVGVSFRPDSRGKAHSEHDMPGILAINKLNTIGFGLKFTVEAVALPRGATGSETPVREADWGDLQDIDILYIPGAPSANDTQLGSTTEEINFLKPTKEREVVEHTSRSAYELKLISMAKTMGIPILAVCAGSWRLLQSYGGQVRTLPKEERTKHRNTEDMWGTSHGVIINPDSLLYDIIRAFILPKTNTTHWAVAEEESYQLKSSGGGTLSNLLHISARAFGPKIIPTTEAFESRFGAPVLGIQWHPESNLPGMPGHGAEKKQDIASARLFRFMAESGRTGRARRNVVAEFHVMRLRQIIGLHTDKDAWEVYEDIVKEFGHPPTSSEINAYLSVFNLSYP